MIGGSRSSSRLASPVPRLWFLNQDHTQLIQFQPDRFIYNWRKIGSTSAADYPRYEFIRTRFIEQYAILQSFLNSQRLGHVEPNQCEVTYVNNIPSGQDEELASAVGRVIRFWTDPPSSGALTPIEDMRFLFRSPLYGADGRFVGRLTVATEPAGRQDGIWIIRLTLTSRGLPLQDTDEGVFQFFDLGRDRIVRAFTELTTEEMHNRWERSEMTFASMLLGCEPAWQPWSCITSDPQTLTELDQPSRAHVGPPVSAFGQGAEPVWLRPVQSRFSASLGS